MSNARIEATTSPSNSMRAGTLEAGAVHVDDAAASAHLPRFADLGNAPVSGGHEAAEQVLGIALETALECDRAGTHALRRRHEPVERRGGKHRDRRIGVAQADDRLEPVVAHGRRGELMTEGDDIEGRQIDDTLFTEEEFEIVTPRLGAVDVGRDHGHRTAASLEEGGENERSRAPRGSADANVRGACGRLRAEARHERGERRVADGHLD